MIFQLRPFRIADTNPLVKHANNPKIAANLTDKFPHPYTQEHALHFIQNAMKHSPSNVLAITIDDEVVGGIGIHPQDDIQRKNAELGYWLAEQHWGKGIVSAAIPLMVEYGFKNFDIDRIFARPFGTNIASQKVLEKSGFKLEARFEKTLLKNGFLLDELVYAIRR
ncbi:MAG: GNAT family N-acetyltransferase [Bacteroidetes bacterium]|nr:GNAT family N-acetyltransferase [Bacteroidota bacterium]